MRALKSLWVVLLNEPVLTRTLVGAALIAGVKFGLPISDAQEHAVDALVVAVLAYGARNRVTPVDPAPRAPDDQATILGKALAGVKRAILGKA